MITDACLRIKASQRKCELNLNIKLQAHDVYEFFLYASGCVCLGQGKRKFAFKLTVFLR